MGMDVVVMGTTSGASSAGEAELEPNGEAQTAAIRRVKTNACITIKYIDLLAELFIAK